MPDHPLLGKTIEYTGMAWNVGLQADVQVTNLLLDLEEIDSTERGSCYIAVEPGAGLDEDMKVYCLDLDFIYDVVWIEGQALPHVTGVIQAMNETVWEVIDRWEFVMARLNRLKHELEH